MTILNTPTRAFADIPIEYPESDGEPMGESDKHVEVMIEVCNELKTYYAHAPETYVTADTLFYYVEGNPKIFVVPDIMVAHGAGAHKRGVYKLWLDRVVPQFVIEITSPSTGMHDVERKSKLYARLGVTEYFLFDPLLEYLNPPLQGYRLVKRHYKRLVPDQAGALESRVLGLILKAEGQDLRLFNPHTGQRLLTHTEAEAARIAAEAARADAEARVHALEAELARLRAERD